VRLGVYRYCAIKLALGLVVFANLRVVGTQEVAQGGVVGVRGYGFLELAE
jgi:hypothetical protein